jgi:hypothetical protein
MACCSIFDGTACYAGHWGDRSYELASYSPLSEKSLNDAGPLRQLISQKDFVTSILAIAKYLFFEVNKETSLETVDSIISRQLIAAGIDPYVRFDLSRIAWKDGAKDILLIPFSSPGYTVTKGVDTHIIQVALKNNGAEWDMIGMNVDLGDSFVVTIVGKDPVSAISGVPLNVRIGETDKYNSLESSLEAFKGLR